MLIVPWIYSKESVINGYSSPAHTSEGSIAGLSVEGTCKKARHPDFSLGEPLLLSLLLPTVQLSVSLHPSTNCSLPLQDADRSYTKNKEGSIENHKSLRQEGALAMLMYKIRLHRITLSRLREQLFHLRYRSQHKESVKMKNDTFQTKE